MIVKRRRITLNWFPPAGIISINVSAQYLLYIATIMIHFMYGFDFEHHTCIHLLVGEAYKQQNIAH